MAIDNSLIVGIDEVGRGCIAGPVFAAAVILDNKRPVPGLTDSKKITPKKREQLFSLICENAHDYAIGRAEASEIDDINILQASLLAMRRAFDGLKLKPDIALIDGRDCPHLPCEGRTIIQGDLLCPEISAASILAKVARDSEMIFLDRIYTGYEFVKHKGYPTKLHNQRLMELGVTEIHRKSFATVRNLLTV